MDPWYESPAVDTARTGASPVPTGDHPRGEAPPPGVYMRGFSCSLMNPQRRVSDRDKPCPYSRRPPAPIHMSV